MFCPSCGKTIPDASHFCLACGKPVPTVTSKPLLRAERTPITGGAWILLIGIVVVVLAVAWSSIEEAYNNDAPMSASAPASPPTPRSVPVGSEGRLSNNGAPKVPISIDEAAAKEWVKAEVANDQMGRAGLLMADRVFGVPNNTRVLVIDRTFSRSQVRILEGEFAGRSGWVAYEWVKP